MLDHLRNQTRTFPASEVIFRFLRALRRTPALCSFGPILTSSILEQHPSPMSPPHLIIRNLHAACAGDNEMAPCRTRKRFMELLRQHPSRKQKFLTGPKFGVVVDLCGFQELRKLSRPTSTTCFTSSPSGFSGICFTTTLQHIKHFHASSRPINNRRNEHKGP